jgi:hypothetical protein
VALGDIDGDSNLDAVFAGTGRNRVCLGDGSKGFACRDISTDANDTLGVALGDINGDGKLDAVFANVTDSTVEGDSNRLCLGDGSGGFTCGDVSSDTNITRGVALGDIDGDGDLDAVFANFAQQNRVCVVDGSGRIACSDVSSDTNDTQGVALGDIDGDGDLDAVFANSRQPNRVCLGDKLGGFVCNSTSDEADDTPGVAVAPAR